MKIKYKQPNDVGNQRKFKPNYLVILLFLSIISILLQLWGIYRG